MKYTITSKNKPKTSKLKSTELIYSPTLNTILMVEKTLQEIPESVFKVSDIKRALPKKVNHYTLRNILEYLENSNKIYVGIKGITWIYNKNKKLDQQIKKGKEI